MKKRSALPSLLAASLLFGCGNSAPSSSGDFSVAPIEGAANGAFSYVYASASDRTDIHGKLEEYAIKNHLSGLTLYGDGGFVLHHPGIVKGSKEYLPGYGFGVLKEGSIVKDLEGEQDVARKRYLHISQSILPAQANPMNDRQGATSDLCTYSQGVYFTKQINEAKNGYSWVGDLAKTDRPIAMNPRKDGRATVFRVAVKTGSERTYSTASSLYAKYDGRSIALEDYVTPFQILHTSAYGMIRGRQYITGTYALAGLKEYFEGSKDGFNPTLWENVGIKAKEENGEAYLEFAFLSPLLVSEAMNFLTDPTFAPIPKDFIQEIGGGDFAAGVAAYGAAVGNETVIDHVLSTGPYRLEEWSENAIVLQKSPQFAKNGHYSIPGIHIVGIADGEKALSEFLANRLHVCGVPAAKVKEYRDDPRVSLTADSTMHKLNLNTCDATQWENFFGTEGTIVQTEKDKYWDVKPAMHNEQFLRGLSYALDRKGLAAAINRTPKVSYFGDTYFVDSLEGVSYNRTEAHRRAISSIVDGTDGYGFSLAKAKECFQKAASELIADGSYSRGGEIEIEIAWQTKDQVNKEHAIIAKMLEDAFNGNEMPLTLKVKSWVGDTWSDVYYRKMMAGQFDIGYGSISGSAYRPMMLFDLMRSDNRSGFTINWGVDTGVCTEDLNVEFQGKRWSFDALCQAADEGVYCVDGVETPLYALDPKATLVERDNENNLIIEGRMNLVCVPKPGVTDPEGDEDYDALASLSGLAIFGRNDPQFKDYTEEELPLECITLTPLEGEYNTAFRLVIHSNIAAKYEDFTEYAGIDFYFHTVLLGEAPLWPELDGLLFPGGFPK